MTRTAINIERRPLYGPSYMMRTYLNGGDEIYGAKTIVPDKSIAIDGFIIWPIINLNKLGFSTMWSCHGNHKLATTSAYICFAPDVELPDDFLKDLERCGFHHECSVAYDRIGNILPNKARITIRSTDQKSKVFMDDIYQLRLKNAFFLEFINRWWGNR